MPWKSRLGNIYAVGKYGVQQDYIKAAFWLGKAAGQGDAESEFTIGTFYETARGGFPVDGQQAAAWYNNAAEQGDENARAALSRLANSKLGAENEQQKRIYDFNSKLCTASDQRSLAEQRIDQSCIEQRQREVDEALWKEDIRREHEARLAADRASAAKHTTRYGGLYI